MKHSGRHTDTVAEAGILPGAEVWRIRRGFIAGWAWVLSVTAAVEVLVRSV